MDSTSGGNEREMAVHTPGVVSEGNVKANSTSFVRSIDTQVPYLLGACIDSTSDVGGWVANQCGHLPPLPYLRQGGSFAKLCHQPRRCWLK